MQTRPKIINSTNCETEYCLYIILGDGRDLVYNKSILFSSNSLILLSFPYPNHLITLNNIIRNVLYIYIVSVIRNTS